MTLPRAQAIGTLLTLVAGLVGCTVADNGSDTPGAAGSGGQGNPGTAGTNPTGASGAAGNVNNPVGGASATGGQVGTGGVVGTAGAGGNSSTAGAAGSNGTAGAAGGANMGGRPSGPSAGCLKVPPNESPGSQVLHMIDVNGMAAQYLAGYTHRKYCTTIPKDYDPTKAYPVVFYGPGCGATACEGSSFTGRSDIFIVQAIAGADAKGDNIVPSNAAPGCFQAGKNSTPDSPEGPYFDQVMAQVEETYCIDKGQIFAAGTSSGAWLSNYLACARGNVIRGTASDSGGLQFDHGTCTGGASVMEMPGDSAMAKDAKGNEIGAALARDMFIKLNGCSMTPTPMTYGTANCQVYGGCASPILWCDVGGGHQSGNSKLSSTTGAFWPTLK